MSSFDERFDFKDELIVRILNYLKIAATKIVPTNIRSTLAHSRAAFSQTKLLKLQIELMKETRRKEIEANIAVETRRKELEQKFENSKLKEQTETNKKEREQELKQSEQSLTEIDQKSKQIEENEQCTTKLESEPNQPTGKVVEEELKQKLLKARTGQGKFYDLEGIAQSVMILVAIRHSGSVVPG